VTRQTRPPAAAPSTHPPAGAPAAPATPPIQTAEQAQAAAAELWNTRFKEFRQFLNQRADVIRRFCHKGSPLDAARLIACAELEWRRDPQLVWDSSWQSMVTSLVTAAQLDLEPTGPLADGYLEHRMDKALGCQAWTFRTMYRGLVKLACRSNLVKRVRAHVVYKNDFLQIDLGSEPCVLHRVCLDADRGPILGAYAVATLAEGEAEPEWIPLADLQKIRAQSQATSSPWDKWFDQMARKSVIRRLCKQLPAGDDYARMEAIESAIDNGDAAAVRHILGVGEDPGAPRQLGAAVQDPLVEVINRPVAPPQSKGAEALTAKIAASQQARAAAKQVQGPPVEVQSAAPPPAVAEDPDEPARWPSSSPPCSECGASWQNDWKPGCFACSPPVAE
jgi:recombination protein RecT